jgi:hypothetical protein
MNIMMIDSYTQKIINQGTSCILTDHIIFGKYLPIIVEPKYAGPLNMTEKQSTYCVLELYSNCFAVIRRHAETFTVK